MLRSLPLAVLTRRLNPDRLLQPIITAEAEKDTARAAKFSTGAGLFLLLPPGAKEYILCPANQAVNINSKHKGENGYVTPVTQIVVCGPVIYSQLRCYLCADATTATFNPTRPGSQTR